jgi:hypothetical protein
MKTLAIVRGCVLFVSIQLLLGCCRTVPPPSLKQAEKAQADAGASEIEEQKIADVARAFNTPILFEF